MASSENESKLHPASDVFRNVITGEISAENKRFDDDIERLRPLLEHVQYVELIGAISDAPIVEDLVRQGDGSFFNRAPPPTKKVIAEANLSQGTVDDAGEKLHIPIQSSHKMFISNLGFTGGVGVRMAGESLGHYPLGMLSRSPNVLESIFVTFSDSDDTACLSIYISDRVSIHGELNDLSNEDIINLKENARNTLSLYMSSSLSTQLRDMNAHSPTFAPMSIQMDLTPDLKDTLSLIEKAGPSPPCEDSREAMCPSDELRKLTIAALGEEEHKESMDENRRLKLQHEAILAIKEKALRVEIAHAGGVLDLSLQDGELKTDDDGSTNYVVKVTDEENASMPVDSIKYITIYQSGTLLNGKEPGGMHAVARRTKIVDTPGIQFAGLDIGITPEVNLLGFFNWFDLPEDEVADFAPGFYDGLHVALLGNLQRDGVPLTPFPPRFKLKLVEVRFSLRSIERILNLAGLGDKLDLDAVQGEVSDA